MPIENLLLLTQNKYTYAVVILAAFFILSKLILLISRTILLYLAKKTKTKIDDLMIKKSNLPISIMLLLIGLKLAIVPLGFQQSIFVIVEHAISTIITIILTYLAIILADILLDNWGNKIAFRAEPALYNEVIPLFKKFSRIFISVIGLVFILPIWSIQIGPLLAGLGVAGLAVAFALQNTLGNIFGGASILLDKSIKVGDVIKVDNETIGSVVDVGLRSTKVKTFDNEYVTVPNGKLADSKIINFAQPDPTVRFSADFGVEYGSDTSKVRKIVLDTVKKIPDVLKKPAPKVLMMEMGDFALKFTVLFWVSGYTDRYDNTKADVVENIYNALTKAGIGIPFPTRTVFVKKK